MEGMAAGEWLKQLEARIEALEAKILGRAEQAAMAAEKSAAAAVAGAVSAVKLEIQKTDPLVPVAVTATATVAPKTDKPSTPAV